MADVSHIRNFALIAHIDHGKSTLADRLIQKTGGLSEREMRAQVLDNMELERERGITIKAQTVRLLYRHQGEDYILNLIDTPGHVDFSYEVSRSLKACEGALLLVDAAQGVEAQTLANSWAAIEADLEILPVINKIDLPAADVEMAASQIEEVIGLDVLHRLEISAKSGVGVDALLEAMITRLPPPQGDRGAPLKMLLIDSWYDSYLGVVVLVRVLDGVLRKHMNIHMMGAAHDYLVDEVGFFEPKKSTAKELSAGEIGYFTASIREVADARIGDTIIASENANDAIEALPGFRAAQSVVFCALYPEDSSRFDDLREAMARLHLNDAAFQFEPETSVALGMGFRCGFLGLLHMDIITERIEREFKIDLVSTAPGVIYRLTLTDDTTLELHNPADMPEWQKIAKIEEPWVRANILTPEKNLGAVISLCENRRGRQNDLVYMATRIMAVYDLPLSEIIFDFHDQLKSVSRGFASFDYQPLGYEEGDLVRLSVLVNNEPVDALFSIVHRSRAEQRGRTMCKTLKEEIPRHLFKVPLQAAIGGRIVARETIPAMRKDVTAKCYGGDMTRKRKLLEKQKAGKKKMRQFGQVEIPHRAFLAVLKGDQN